MFDSSSIIVSTFPPKPCGLATFSSALLNGLGSVGVGDTHVLAVSPRQHDHLDPRVVGTLHPDSISSVTHAANILNQYNVVFLQHEYGIFGHSEGQGALDLLTQLEVPVISTLHSVPLRPTSRQKIVLEEVVGHSAAAVTMTEVAHQRLFGLYEVDESKIMTIPHGATIPPNAGLTSAQPPLLLTWGLLGPGKGIEWVLEAIALIKDEVPNFRYLVAGQTHPNIVRDSGEAYREMLQAKVQELGIGSIVQFDASYKPLGSLLDLIRSAACVVLPYESMDQITSGVLVDAIAASKPVIATQFSHAVELLSGGAGILVPPQNPEEMSRAIKRVLHHPEAVIKMAGRAAQLAPLHTWSTVARQYSTIARRVTFNSKIGVAS